MLRSIHIKDFKSYRDATLHLGGITLLIGANASGKSNALEALRFLSWMAQGQKLGTLQFHVNQWQSIVRGSVWDLVRQGQSAFTFGCTIENGHNLDFSLTIEYRGDQGLHITNESLTDRVSSKPLYRTTKPTHLGATDIAVEYDNFSKGRYPQIHCSDQEAMFVQLTNASRFSEKHARSGKVISPACKQLEEHLSNIIFLDPVPAVMRGYSFLTEGRLLAGDGSNLSAVLNRLWNSSDENKSQILDFIRSLPEQDIHGLAFLTTPRHEVMVQLVESFKSNNRAMDAALLSDGTLRILAVAATLLSAPEKSLVVIEEIDNGVHPSRAKRLLESIASVALKRKLKVLLSSHNPALLDALPSSSIPDVNFCYRDKDEGHSVLVKLGDIERYPELIIQGSLGALVTNEIVDLFIKNRLEETEKKKASLNWLLSRKNSNHGE